jgi:hypothetical protein
MGRSIDAMSSESVAPMPPPPSLSPADRLLYALRESDVPTVRARVGRDFGFHLPSDRWRHLTAGLVEACSLAVFAYGLLAVLLEGRPDRVWLLLPPLYLLAWGLRRGAGRRPVTRWTGWFLAVWFALTLLVGLGAVPEGASGLLPWLGGLVVAAGEALAARRMGVTTEPAVDAVPAGAAPLLIAAVLRDQEGASLRRLEKVVPMQMADLQEWLTAMTQAGVLRMEKAFFAPPVAHLTNDGRLWLEAWTEPLDRTGA